MLLLGHLALPIDLIPDFVPVLGYADDAIIVAFVLRSLRGVPARRRWPNTGWARLRGWLPFVGCVV